MKLLITLFYCTAITFTSFVSLELSEELSENQVIHANEEVPSYAKWGRIVMQKTKEKYPDADIVDYLHVGKEEGTNLTTEKFKLWLKGKDSEFGVYIDVKFATDTEQIIEISFREVSS
ncbi:DUF3889 domain-containing protein [Virgibacillus necropolis]|uniref:DUF3889 domain-containing protein n=1 Tax=Virgibacillus necropolis TaxID=163877 RepID=A0A221MFP7_9BACI|nr:DUF3889 domain-containing protein [Virgibacillus necropolis]ASN06409.1 hypothetical protein CFK40_15985 [Virgibacillus necropolis]